MLVPCGISFWLAASAWCLYNRDTEVNIYHETLTKHHHKSTKYASSIHQTMQTQIAVFTVVVPLHLKEVVPFGALSSGWLKKTFATERKSRRKGRVCAKHECTTAVTKVLKTDLNDVCCRKGSRLRTPLRQA